jgi:hypothetical protein
MNFHEFMCSHEAKNNKNLNNLLNRFFLMHPNYVLCKISSSNVHIEVVIKNSYIRQNLEYLYEFSRTREYL